jgi:hypothetical protein
VENFSIRDLARSYEYIAMSFSSTSGFATENNTPELFTFIIYAVEQSVLEWTVRPTVRVFCIAACVWGMRNLQYLMKTIAYFIPSLIASCKENVHAFVDFNRPNVYKYPGCCVKE